MAWWGWLLVTWAALSVVGGICVGMAIRIGERRDLGEDRPGERSDLDDRDAA